MRYRHARTDGVSALAWATGALIVVTVGRAPDLVPALDGVPLVKLLTVAAVLLAIASPQSGRPPLSHSRIVQYVAALVVLAVASVAFSYWRGMSVAVLLGTFAAIVALTLLVYATAGRLETLEFHLKALAWAGAALALRGLAFDASGRLSFGRTYDPNDLAFVLIAILPVPLALWRRSSGPGAWLWAGIAAGMTWVILLTQSRGGLLGLLVACGYLVAVGAWRAGFEARPRIARVFVGAVLAVVFAAAAWTVLPADARERYATMLDPTSDYNYTAEREGRVAVWGRGLHTLAAVPWGVGVGAYPMAEMARSGYWRTAHNSLLEMAVELGVLGLAVYIALLSRAWRVLGRVIGGADVGPAGDDRWRLYSQHLRASLLGMLVAGFFLSQAYALVAFTLYAIVAALEAHERGALAIVAPRRRRALRAATASSRRAPPREDGGRRALPRGTGGDP